MKKNIILSISLILNIILIYMLNFNTPFFDDSIVWSLETLHVSGVISFNNDKDQPDTKKFVQYYLFKCFLKKCNIVENTLSDRKYISSRLYDADSVNINYDLKEATIKYDDCIFTITQNAATFNCAKGNETGVLGSHISLHYKLHGLFN